MMQTLLKRYLVSELKLSAAVQTNGNSAGKLDKTSNT